MFIAQPSFALLYILDEVIAPAITIKTIGFLYKLNGLKSHILNKIKDTIINFSFGLAERVYKNGKKSIILMPCRN
jgi:hypothetical protein